MIQTPSPSLSLFDVSPSLLLSVTLWLAKLTNTPPPTKRPEPQRDRSQQSLAGPDGVADGRVLGREPRRGDALRHRGHGDHDAVDPAGADHGARRLGDGGRGGGRDHAGLGGHDGGACCGRRSSGRSRAGRGVADRCISTVKAQGAGRGGGGLAWVINRYGRKGGHICTTAFADGFGGGE